MKKKAHAWTHKALKELPDNTITIMAWDNCINKKRGTMKNKIYLPKLILACLLTSLSTQLFSIPNAAIYVVNNTGVTLNINRPGNITSKLNAGQKAIIPSGQSTIMPESGGSPKNPQLIRKTVGITLVYASGTATVATTSDTPTSSEATGTKSYSKDTTLNLTLADDTTQGRNKLQKIVISE